MDYQEEYRVLPHEEIQQPAITSSSNIYENDDEGIFYVGGNFVKHYIILYYNMIILYYII